MPSTSTIKNLKKDDKNFNIGVSEERVNELITEKLNSSSTSSELKYITSFRKTKDIDYTNIDMHRKQILFKADDTIIIGNKDYKIGEQVVNFDEAMIPGKVLVYMIFKTSDLTISFQEMQAVNLADDQYIVGTIFSDTVVKDIVYLDFPFDIRVDGEKRTRQLMNNPFFKCISHYGQVGDGKDLYPVQSLLAFKYAKRNGFEYVACMVGFTSDNVPVLVMNDNLKGQCMNAAGEAITVDTSLKSLTYDVVKTYDFGLPVDVSFKNTRVFKFEDFM